MQDGEGEKPKRSSIPKGMNAPDIDLAKALALLSLPREVAKHPTSGDPIVAGIGRFGPYVQHQKTYANIGKDESILEIGGNRAIDLIVAKESGAAGERRFGQSEPGRVLGDHPDGGKVSVKAGRFGAYVNHGKINATLAKGSDPAALTLDEALVLIKAKAAGGGGGGRLLGEHPMGGPIMVRDGRYGAYVSHGKVNATLSKDMSPETVTLDDAVTLIENKGGPDPKAIRKAPKKAAAKKAPSTKAPAKKPTAKKAAPKKAALNKKAKAAE